MGLWDWMMDRLSGRSYSDGKGRGPAATVPRQSANSAVAILEPPEDGAIQSEPEWGTQCEPPWWAPPGVTTVEPIRISPPDMSVEIHALEEKLISQFDGHDLALPPMPNVAERVLRRLRDPKSGAENIAKDMAEDQVTTAYVLRIANSAMYGGTTKITSLQAAVARLGNNAIRTVMLHQSMRAAVFHGKVAFPQLTNLVWHNALAGAYVMRELAPLAKLNADEAFLIGLLHDIGNVVVLREVSQYQRLLRSDIDRTTFNFLCQETHQEFGELVAQAWELPPDLQSLIADHHSMPSPDDPLRRQRMLIMLTDMVNQMLGYAPPASYDLLQCVPVKELGLENHPGFAKLLPEFPKRIESNIRSLA